jgi:hypothetical protein
MYTTVVSIDVVDDRELFKGLEGYYIQIIHLNDIKEKFLEQ